MLQSLRKVGCFCLAVLLSVTLVSAHSFTDVPAGHWAEDAITRGVDLGLFNGTSATTFGMDTAMTRGSFVVLLSRVLDWDTSTATTTSFTDVATTSWCYGAVEAALTHQAITTQYTTFRPTESITREEMAVMLARALGYTTLSGLVQDLSMPFTDVSTNRGYIAIVYELGLMTGTTATSFAPAAQTTRAQTAVILMRLYDKLHAQQETYAIVSDYTDTVALQSQSIIAIPGAKLSTGTSARINPQVSTANQQAAIDTVHANDGTALLYLTGTTASMRGTVDESVDVIITYMETIGYDGVFLDVPELTVKERAFYTQLVQALKAALGEKTLFVMAEAPAWQTTQYYGYDYANLSSSVDRLVLRIAPYQDSQDSFLIAPMEPMEELYYALTHLPVGTDTSVVSLLITTTATSRTGTSGVSTLSASELTPYLTQSTSQIRTSERYGCEYLIGQYVTASRSQDIVIWYLNGQQVANRMDLCKLFDIDSVVLSDASSLLADVASVVG